MRRHWEAASPGSRRAWVWGNWRLYERWEAFNARKKRSVVPTAAIARELAGWCWSLAVLDD